MVEHNSKNLDLVFQALADPTRRQMLKSLAERKTCTVSQMAEPFEMSFAAASKHVKVLERASLLTRRIEGQKHLCTFEPGALAEADSWISFYKHFWSDRLDALEALFTTEGGKDGST